jgi:hypothetical protein
LPAHKAAFNLTCHLDVEGQRLRPKKNRVPQIKKNGGGGENLQKNDGLMGQKEVVHLGLSQNERKMETRRWQTRIVVATDTHDRDDGRHSYLDTQRNKRIASF